MICFVDIEHEKVLHDPEKRNTHLALCTEIKLKLEEIVYWEKFGRKERPSYG